MGQKEDNITLPQVGDVSKTVADDIDEINTQTGRAFNLYNDIRDRAQEGLPEQHEWNFDAGQTQLQDIGIENTTVSLSSDVEQDLHNIDTPDTVSFDSETVSEYVEDITTRIDEVRTTKNQLESRIDSAEQISQQASSDFVDSTQLLESYEGDPSSALEGSWGENLEQHLTAQKGKAETRKAVEDMTMALKSEQVALENELTNVVNRYVSEAYDRAANTSEELGGTARPREGEVDLLAKVADSRGEIIENRGDAEDYDFVPPEVAAQSALMDVSKEAMESQAALVAQYAAQMGRALDEAHSLLDSAEGYASEENLEPSYSAVEAMKGGFGEMANIADEECYDNFSEAIRSVMRRGMTEDEQFDDEYSFAMDDISYVGSSEEAGGRL